MKLRIEHLDSLKRLTESEREIVIKEYGKGWHFLALDSEEEPNFFLWKKLGFVRWL